MGRTGAKCKICADPALRAKIDAALMRKETQRVIAQRYNLTQPKISDHAGHASDSRAAVNIKPDLAPPAPVDTTNRAAMQAHVARLLAQLNWASAHETPLREHALLSGQYISAVKTLAKLDGSLDITEGQIVRSAPFQRILLRMRAALAPYPEAVVALGKSLEGLE